MTQSMSDSAGRAQVRANTVQGYIDETPVWPDGTLAPATPMTDMQQRIWWLAVAGKFFEGMVVFMTGVALPLIANEFGLSALQHGIVGAATLFGILVGVWATIGIHRARQPLASNQATDIKWRATFNAADRDEFVSSKALCDD